MSNLLVNARFFNQQVTGVQRYAREIVRLLERDLRLIKAPIWAQGVGGHMWEQLVLPTRVGREDLIWSPANTGPLFLENQVVTIHDLSVIEHPDWFSTLFARWYGFILPQLVTRTRHVITDSAYSKGKLREILDMSPADITVVYPGVANEFLEGATESDVKRVLATYRLNNPYLLTVGSLQPRKNLQTLFRVWAQLSSEFTDVDLVVVGAEASHFRGRGFEDVPANTRFLGYVPESDLAGLYTGGLAFVFLSLYEGFGLPVLEAMASGTPVIVSNRTALPEVVGDSGLLVDPTDESAIRNGMSDLVRERDLRSVLGQKGRERATKFTWERAADRVLKVLSNARKEWVN